MTFLIAEISNHHIGSVDKAKELIRIAKESGANAVKGQAFAAEDMMKWGVMPLDFYESCALKYHEYKDLIFYGDSIGIPVFFTVLSSKLTGIIRYQKYKKLHAAYTKACRREKFWFYDKENVFLSMSEPRHDLKAIKKARLLYATPYLEDVDIEGYEALQKYYQVKVGVSHHGKSYEKLIELMKSYDVPWVEKHFFLGEEITWKGQVYRDCLHSLKPDEFEKMASELKKR